ncbi:prepilin-type N-terminal cleavage/methylation domain-containing protein [Roseateles saccharophilus]|uniref:Type IV pilus assembly protein PilV n=1 Tax=Roseateles saccharophilus TaxID=304 RepID=A0A4R3UH27_ROSSA|nr:prepilin-type N-terminal cleavage/methylation domain-containing protein [Roseateles saccharophilus]MDG0834098.1 prepilin-type N-terminal cleavage/methylation domain-containing protein [Roseateles saccharophilus]TCU90826.1 type IV pilus assembly protein PilV [Roseateles saccharophilus]
MMPIPTRRSARGYSLLELLVAVLIISFGLLSMMTLQTQMLRASIGSEDGQRAALLASEMAATIVNANTVDLPQSVVDNWATKVADPGNGGLPNGVGTVTASAAGSSARITITWRPVQSNGAANDNHQYVTDVIP